MVVNSAELIERALWNVEIGGYVRFLPFSAAERIGLPGPSPLFSAWMAQFHYDMGNKDRAEAIIRWLFDHSAEGQLPELLIPGSAASRFLPEQRRLIAQSEQSATQDGAELRRMRSRLDAIDEASELREVIAGGTPLIWAHLETLRALYRGGYLDSWQLDPAAVGLAGDSQPP